MKILLESSNIMQAVTINCKSTLPSLTTPNIWERVWESVEQNVLWRSTRPFFPPPQIKTEKKWPGNETTSGIYTKLNA